MNRRKALVLTALPVVIATETASARLRCGQWNVRGVQQCEAGIDSRIASVTVNAEQHLSQWCWAACIEMVFRYYGFHVPQARIVSETWGGIVNLPGRPDQIMANLNRPWVDERGRRFSVAGDVYTANPMTAAQDLAANMPLIIGTGGHAMVLTSLAYDRDWYGGGVVTSAVVRDPWPDKGRRNLTPQEWHGTRFLARIRVSRPFDFGW